MSTAMKLSIIIPVYNVEHYLRECLESILTQQEKGIEVILVDDGSTDGSGRICDEYGEKYDSVRVIHKENGGPASARNLGIRVAAGEYLAFVDSDDRIVSGSLARILRWIGDEGTDICSLEASRIYPDGRKEDLGDNITRDNVRGKTPEEVMAYLASRPKFPGSVWAKIFRREWILAEKISFPEDRDHGEDLAFCRDSYLIARSFDVLPGEYYEYRQGRRGSLSSMKLAVCFRDLLLYVTESVELLTRDRIPLNKKAEFAMSFAAYEYSIILWHYARMKEPERPAAYQSLQQYRWVIDFGASLKQRGIAWLMRLLGIRMTANILTLYMHLRSKGKA